MQCPRSHGETARSTNCCTDLLLDGVAASEDDGHLRKRVGLNGGHAAGAAIRELFVDDARLNRVQPEPAVLFGNVAVGQPHLPRLVEHVVRELHRAVQLGGLRNDHVAREVACRDLERLLVLAEVEAEALCVRREAARGRQPALRSYLHGTPVKPQLREQRHLLRREMGRS